jgi:hypothetical protein
MDKKEAKQQQEIGEEFAYNQGQGDYNIWYDKYMNETLKKDKKFKKEFRLKLEDIGSTFGSKEHQKYICLYFS